MTNLRRARVAVSSAYGVQGLSLAILVTRIPTIKDRFGLDDGGLAAILVLVPVMAGVGSVLAGTLTSRIHSKPVLRVAGPIVPLSVAAAGYMESLTAFTIAVAVLGIALGVVDATMNMQAVSLEVEYGRPVISSCYAWYSLVSIVGALLAAGAASLEMGLGPFFLACAAVAVAVQLSVGRFLLPDISPAPVDGVPTVRVPWQPVILIGIALMCAYVLDSATQNWSAVYLADGLGSPDSVAALAYGVYSLTLLIGRIAVDRVVVRTGGPRLVRLAAIGAVAAIAILAAAPSSAIALIAFALLGLLVAPMIPLAFVAAASHDPAATGRAVARVNVFNYVGVLLGAPLIGVIAEVSSLRVGIACLAVAPIAIALLASSYAVSPAAAGPTSR